MLKGLAEASTGCAHTGAAAMLCKLQPPLEASAAPAAQHKAAWPRRACTHTHASHSLAAALGLKYRPGAISGLSWPPLPQGLRLGPVLRGRLPFSK